LGGYKLQKSRNIKRRKMDRPATKLKIQLRPQKKNLGRRGNLIEAENLASTKRGGRERGGGKRGLPYINIVRKPKRGSYLVNRSGGGEGEWKQNQREN